MGNGSEIWRFGTSGRYTFTGHKFFNSITIVNKKNHKIFALKEINKNTILVFDDLPLKIEKFNDVVNAHLIKQKYNFQSKLNIKNYILNIYGLL